MKITYKRENERVRQKKGCGYDNGETYEEMKVWKGYRKYRNRKRKRGKERKGKFLNF